MDEKIDGLDLKRINEERRNALDSIYNYSKESCYYCKGWAKNDFLSDYVMGFKGECDNKDAKTHIERWPYTLAREKCIHWEKK